MRVAKELRVVPFILARYVDQDILYNEIYLKKGLAYRYEELLLPRVYSSLAEDARKLLGYPVLAVDVLPDYKVNWLEKLHLDFVGRSGV